MQILDSTIQPAEPELPVSPRKLGRFLVPAADFQQWDRLLPLMAQMVVMATVYHPDIEAVEYTAFCERFEVSDPDTIPPLYEYRIEMRERGAHLFMRKSPEPTNEPSPFPFH